MKIEPRAFAPADGGGASTSSEAASPAAAAPIATPVAAPAFDWAGALGDKHGEFQPVLTAKGWKSPADALFAYTSLESLVGGKPADPAAYPAFQRPAEVPDALWNEGMDVAFRKAAHDAGLTDKQASGMFGWYTGLLAEGSKAQAAQNAQVEQTLRTEFGPAFDTKIAVAQRAAKRFGGDAVFDALESRVGGAAMVKLFAAVGEAMSEDTLAGSTASGDAAPATPEAARARLKDLDADQDFQSKLWNPQHAGHRQAVEQRQALFKAAYPQKG